MQSCQQLAKVQRPSATRRTLPSSSCSRVGLVRAAIPGAASSTQQQQQQQQQLNVVITGGSKGELASILKMSKLTNTHRSILASI
jgi:hypothetical protein